MLFRSGGENLKLLKGFTLAEVLITLGIIGVVAALTLPSLISNHQEKVKITKLKKAYSVLSNAYIMTQSKYGDVDNWTDVDLNTFTDTRPLSQQLSSDIGNKFLEVIKYDKLCDTLDNNSKCWKRTNPLSFLNGAGHGGKDRSGRSWQNARRQAAPSDEGPAV